MRYARLLRICQPVIRVVEVVGGLLLASLPVQAAAQVGARDNGLNMFRAVVLLAPLESFAQAALGLLQLGRVANAAAAAAVASGTAL